jgi:hypothetical protein
MADELASALASYRYPRPLETMIGTGATRPVYSSRHMSGRAKPACQGLWFPRCPKARHLGHPFSVVGPTYPVTWGTHFLWLGRLIPSPGAPIFCGWPDFSCQLGHPFSVVGLTSTGRWATDQLQALLLARREVALLGADLVTPVVAIEIDGAESAVILEIRRHIGQRILAAQFLFDVVEAV